MTCIEDYMRRNPSKNPDHVIANHCPNGYGDIDIDDPEYCGYGRGYGWECIACWNRQIPKTEAVKPQEAPITAENALKVMLDPGAKMPTRAHTADAGLDLYSPVDTIVFPRWRKGAKHSATIDTGVHVAIPVGYVGDVKSKSSLMMQDIITDGTVDSGYTGSIRVKLWNLGVEPVHIQAGQKIAQLVLKRIITPVPVLVDSLEETDRGEGGFGSTGAF